MKINIYTSVYVWIQLLYLEKKKKTQYFKASMYSSLDYTTEKKKKERNADSVFAFVG